MPKKVFVAGHRGMVGSALVRILEKRSDVELILRRRDELDLTDQRAVEAFFREQPLDEVYLAAARVGGIRANDTFPADFILENLLIQNNVIGSAWRAGVGKLLFLGSSCIYPRLAEQPMQEDALLTGTLEPTNEPYAIAKIAGIKLCESLNRQYGTDYRSVMPTNLYGPGDNFHPEDSHVVPALIRRFHEASRDRAEEVVVWGSGTPMREFLHVDDMAEGSVHMMEVGREEFWRRVPARTSHVNLGTGSDCTIRELAETVARVVGYQGALRFDASRPDGTPRKLLDVGRAAELGWRARRTLESGLRSTYQWYLENEDEARG
ncbi:MAG: GDP-fucose synthetase [Gammaproteobacteria bacterium]|nr:GDP-fucose synthetase [Gammaproteobacteria bacterium]|tara:strand:- start:24203 stop:25165 length:963 start_codon:yes stop_codon:yes gene_type:complete